MALIKYPECDKEISNMASKSTCDAIKEAMESLGAMVSVEEDDGMIVAPAVSGSTRAICPFCRSYNTTKIGVLSRTISVCLWGIGSGKVGKQWHYNDCKSDF